MKTKKEQIFDFLHMHANGESEPSDADIGVTTQYIAQALDIQRTNVSSILNNLVIEGLADKTKGRPVRYYVRKAPNKNSDGCFINLTGCNGSLHQIVQHAKAVILYPVLEQNTVVVGEKGTGRSFLVELMHEYAIEHGVLPKDAILRKYDCFDYTNGDIVHYEDVNKSEMLDEVDLLNNTNTGILFINNAHLLTQKSRKQLLNKIDRYRESAVNQENYPIIIFSCDIGNKAAVNDFQSKLPISITLPTLAQRPLSERMELICRQFTLEAARAKKTFRINSQLLRCLLLYECALNIEQLKSDIKLGCANAYVREYKNKDDKINVYISDFEHYVRKGFIYYKKYRDEIEVIIPSDYEYSFNDKTMEMLPRDLNRVNKSVNVYDVISYKAGELENNGFSEEDVNHVLDAELERTFVAYHKSIIKQVDDKRQLSMLVEDKIIRLVEEFLEQASEQLQRVFSPSVFFGLCLHISAMLNNKEHVHAIPTEQANDIIENYKTEYLLCVQFAAKLQQEYSVTIPINEAALLAMFICYPHSTLTISDETPVLLYILQGLGIAKALTKTVSELTGNSNAFYFDIPLDKDYSEVYTELKAYIEEINRGKGVIVFYDADTLEPILDILSIELNIPLRRISYPLITPAIEHSRTTLLHNDIDDAYKALLQEQVTNRTRRSNKAIITLCSSGKGGAEQIKDYLIRYGQISNFDVIPLAMSANEPLQREIMDIMKEWTIHCIVGTHDPKLFSIPFISLSSVFSVKPEELPSVLRFEKKKREEIDWGEVYTYLSEQLEMVDIDKLKKTLPAVLEDINKNIGHLSLDAEIGLFVHVACYINRVLSKEHLPVNNKKESIISKHSNQYKKLVQLIKPIERRFNIIFSDDEIAHVIAIINKE